MDCENKCVNAHRFERIEKDLKELRDKNSKDHEKFYSRIEENEKKMVESVEDRKHMTEKLDKIDANVESLMQKPVKQYETIVTSILTGVIGALIGFIMSGILPL